VRPTEDDDGVRDVMFAGELSGQQSLTASLIVALDDERT
jgi:hypothetical protein